MSSCFSILIIYRFKLTWEQRVNHCSPSHSRQFWQEPTGPQRSGCTDCSDNHWRKGWRVAVGSVLNCLLKPSLNKPSPLLGKPCSLAKHMENTGNRLETPVRRANPCRACSAGELYGPQLVTAVTLPRVFHMTCLIWDFPLAGLSHTRGLIFQLQWSHPKRMTEKK